MPEAINSAMLVTLASERVVVMVAVVSETEMNVVMTNFMVVIAILLVVVLVLW